MKAVLSIDPIKFPLTGVGRYTYELARGLQNANLEDLQFLRGFRLQDSLPLPDDGQPMARTPLWAGLAQRSRVAVKIFRTFNPLLKSVALKGLDGHIFHGPNYYLPPFRGRSVVTIHDLSPYLWSDSHPPERVRYMQAEIELSLKRATAIITDTEFTKMEVAKFFGWPLDRIHSVQLASGPEFRPREAHDLKQILSAYDLEPAGYALFAGTVEPRKNIGVLLDAYAQLPMSLRTRWPLVIAGYRGWGSDALHRRLSDAQQEGWLRYLGFVSNDMLPRLMAGARLFCYPSFYEGFGLPVLEAMASGVPVVCSNASTLPEVTAGAAALHDPGDVDALLALLRSGLEDANWRRAMSRAGLMQAAKYSWERCTSETLNVYRAALAS